MLKLTYLFLVSFLVIGDHLTSGAKCGETEFFEYKFRPISVRPVKDEDIEDSSDRCTEKKCDIMITLFGVEHCHVGDHGFQFAAPDNDNEVIAAEFQPSEHGYKTFADWRLSDARKTPFKIQVCDDDGFFGGANDDLMTNEHQELRQGCHRYYHRERDNEDHPWKMEYEICCRAYDSPERRRERNRERHRNRHGDKYGGGDQDWWEERQERRKAEARREAEEEDDFEFF